ncbi:hypothetical protein OUZ56_018305 [Daphnia magna]|uniref:Uncharacterized protein n=1 Tax=Daphnia magna TaxID=35525 RepID=A0ABQ9Z8G5_9CRUS|nr:hypothetical protein OUZ56_018305 [Daphnia magna]
MRGFMGNPTSKKDQTTSSSLNVQLPSTTLSFTREGGCFTEGIQNLETETMKCDTPTTSLTVSSKDNPSKPIKESQMTALDTETQDQEPMKIIMESMEPNMGEIETMESDKTKDPLRIPTIPQNKRFKPTLTTQNSKPTSGIPLLIKPNK